MLLARNIQWAPTSNPNIKRCLPAYMPIPDGYSKDEASAYIARQTGWHHQGFDFVSVNKTDTSFHRLKKLFIREHRTMWRTIARETRENQKPFDKIDYMEVYNKPDLLYVPHHCYLCGYADRLLKSHIIMKSDFSTKSVPSCYQHCPLIWPQKGKCYDRNDLYAQWCQASQENDWETAANLADKITKLPERRSYAFEYEI